jgi:hypothetical protein
LESSKALSAHSRSSPTSKRQGLLRLRMGRRSVGTVGACGADVGGTDVGADAGAVVCAERGRTRAQTSAAQLSINRGNSRNGLRLAIFMRGSSVEQRQSFHAATEIRTALRPGSDWAGAPLQTHRPPTSKDLPLQVGKKLDPGNR